MVFNIFFPFSDFVYILQQEEYSSSRYIKWLSRFFFRRNIQKRGHLKYTARAKVIVGFALLLSIIALSTVCLEQGILAITLSVILSLIAIPLFVLLSNLILYPLFAVARRWVMGKASEKVARQKGLKIIAVAGSFGKTTTKNFVYELVRYNHKTQLIPENINTPLGIADWVNGHLMPQTRLLIVEMDAYKRGEIAESCLITPPDIAVVTTIGDQHLERFSGKENLALALSEVFAYAKPGAQLFCDAATAQQLPHSKERSLTIVGPGDLGLLESHPDIIARFSPSNRINLAFAIKIAEALSVSKEFIIDTCTKLELPDRRQKLVVFHDYDCVDDSYNISFTTAQAGIAFARASADQKKKKLLVVTTGIPELGPADQDKNEMLGKVLGEKADHVAVLKSMFYKEVAKGISEPAHYTLFADLQEFLRSAKEQFPPKDWLLLLQPELTDLYY